MTRCEIPIGSSVVSVNQVNRREGCSPRVVAPLGRHGSGTLKIFIEKAKKGDSLSGSSSIREMAPVMIEERPRERFWEKAGPGVLVKGCWRLASKALDWCLKKRGRAAEFHADQLSQAEVQSIRERRSNRSALATRDRPFVGKQAVGLDLSDFPWDREDFSTCDLRGTDLSRCTFSGADFREAEIWNADFSESDLRTARNLFPVVHWP